MPDLIITDAAVLFPDGAVRGGQTIEIKEGIIQSVREAKEGDRELPAKEHISGRGKLVMPGLADCHMHTGQQLLKGRVLDALPMIWTRIMLPFESTLTDEKMELSASLAALEMIKSGTTAFVGPEPPHLWTPEAIIWKRQRMCTCARGFAAFSLHPPWMRRDCRNPLRRMRMRRWPRPTGSMMHTTEKEI